eukprot:7077133-Pyramimonas_sp.AAC.1
MEDIRTYLRGQGCSFASLHPLFDGASDATKRAMQENAASGETRAGAKSKPPAQPAGEPAPGRLVAVGAQAPLVSPSGVEAQFQAVPSKPQPPQSEA